MPNPSAAAYRWLEDDTTSYSAAGCVTVACGIETEGALVAMGADPHRSTPPAEIRLGEGIGWVSVAGSDAGLPEDTVVLVENNGWEGIRPEVLSRLSKPGKAASVYWNVEGLLMFGCARRGKVIATVDLSDPDAADELPATLRRLWERDPDTEEPLAAAMTLVEKYTGVTVPPAPEVIQPTTAYPITSPVLGHRVTRDELLRGRPSEEVVQGVLAATGPQRRALAEWSVRHALAGAGISDLPALASVLSQFGHGRPVSLSAEASAFRREANRWAWAADEALSVDSDLEKWQELRHWGQKHWAMEALAYAADGDDVTAALGATYCAKIPYNSDDVELDRFLGEAIQVLHR
jgi:hypothetical protein